MLYLALKVAVVAFVYQQILMQKDYILYPWYKIVDKYVGRNGDSYAQPKYKWLFKPIVDCLSCVSGQMALWTYLYQTLWLKTWGYSIWEHIYFICVTIFLVQILLMIYTWKTR